ncbi:hypothetical protein L195_g005890 [Trifolium pratense]|uniref:Uncharacterized protein n=1 Tax=Trifolium pratense TaxID=57577 RepID=A0A2K3P229_TRIPR|nr:hypothetical protein L195_g005890 [Trifolium pratense]
MLDRHCKLVLESHPEVTLVKSFEASIRGLLVGNSNLLYSCVMAGNEDETSMDPRVEYVRLGFEPNKRKEFRSQQSNIAKPLLVQTNSSPLVPGASQAIRGYGECAFLFFSKRIIAGNEDEPSMEMHVENVLVWVLN